MAGRQQQYDRSRHHVTTQYHNETTTTTRLQQQQPVIIQRQKSESPPTKAQIQSNYHRATNNNNNGRRLRTIVTFDPPVVPGNKNDTIIKNNNYHLTKRIEVLSAMARKNGEEIRELRKIVKKQQADWERAMIQREQDRKNMLQRERYHENECQKLVNIVLQKHQECLNRVGQDTTKHLELIHELWQERLHQIQKDRQAERIEYTNELFQELESRRQNDLLHERRTCELAEQIHLLVAAFSNTMPTPQQTHQQLPSPTPIAEVLVAAESPSLDRSCITTEFDITEDDDDEDEEEDANENSGGVGGEDSNDDDLDAIE